MGNPKAFLEIHRQEAGYRPIHDRIHDFGEVEQTLSTRERKLQASRCMDCGVPFCHWACPLGNKAPEWNDALYKGDFELAYRLLNSTNPFPEFTGRICPALCEKACVLNRFNHEPTTNREDECAIIEAAFREGFIQPRTDIQRNGKKVAVIGAGPAGASAALTLRHRNKTVAVVANAPESSSLYKAPMLANYPGVKLTGPEFQQALLDQMTEEGVELIHGRALSVMSLGETFGVAVGNDFHEATAVIIAAGITRESAYKGENEYVGKGVSYCATCDGMFFVIVNPVHVPGERGGRRRQRCHIEGTSHLVAPDALVILYTHGHHV